MIYTVALTELTPPDRWDQLDDDLEDVTVSRSEDKAQRRAYAIGRGAAVISRKG